MFPLSTRTADILALCLSVIFQRLLRLGSFPACWRLADVTPILKDPPSSTVTDYRQIFIMPVLSMVFEQFVSVQLGRFMERSSVLLSTQLTSRKGLCTCDALLCVFHTIQSVGEWAGDQNCAD